MKSIWKRILTLTVAAMLVTSIAAAGVSLDGNDVVRSYPLYAGQDWEVGEVLVKTTDDGVCVKFVLTDADAIAEGWLITETHVAVADDATGIPQKNGNPIPGQFPAGETFLTGQTEAGWYCVPATGDAPFAVAAHAKIELPEIGHMAQHAFCVTSGADTDLALGGDAVVAWGEPNPWDARMAEDLNAGNADWIWDAQWVTPNVADNGGLVDFVQDFEVVGTPTSAELKIAADNAFAYSLNGGDETDENLAEGWREQAALGNFDYPGVVIDPSPTAWSVVYTYDVLGSLVPGSNTLNVTAVNADWNTPDPRVNPAAVIYKLCGTSEEYVIDRPYDDESAWGGTTVFPGKNWATYIDYSAPELVDTVEVAPRAAGENAPAVTASAISLESGNNYLLVASGTYRFANWGEYGIADAAWNYRRAANAPGGVAGWYQQASTRLQVWVGGAAVAWQPSAFNPEHIYSLELTGEGGPANFTIEDDNYTDNTGQITVKIYELP